MAKKPVEFETGIIALDLILGGNLPKGKIIELNGESGCGKTTMVLFAASKILAQGGKVLYIDIEKGVDEGILESMKMLQYLNKTLVINQEVSLFSEVQAVIDEALGKNPKDRTKLPIPHGDTPDIIILDSLAMLVPDSSKEKSIEDNVSNNMIMSRYTTQFFRDLVGDLAATGTTFIFVNHLQTKMKKIGFFQQHATQDSAGCGMVKYGPDIRLMIGNSSTLKKERDTIVGKQESKVGTIANVWSKKSRLTANEVKLPILILDGRGVYNGYTLAEICKNTGWVVQGGGGYYKIVEPLAKEPISVRGNIAVSAWLQNNASLVVETLKKENKFKLTYDTETTCMADLLKGVKE